LLTRGQSVLARFLKELGRGETRTLAERELADLPPLLRFESDRLGLRVGEAARFYALCERAWLGWSRLALDKTTFGNRCRATDTTYEPSQVRDAHEAAEAARRCVLHARLLTLADENENESWRVEAARQVHACTKQALEVGARISPGDLPTADVLQPGTVAAAEALATAVRAGFVTDAAREVRETLNLMMRAQEQAIEGTPVSDT
jgi:hypothetical protein